MTSLTQINDTQVSIINFKTIPVVTTAMLAQFYATDTDNIKQNYTRNKERFVEGKHFFKIVGEELKNFVGDLKSLANSTVQVSSKTRNLILWTERGAARHAKMLDTDQAWDIFEQLEDCYFHRQEVLAKTHKSEREPLTNAVNMLVAKTKHLNYSDAYKLVHHRPSHISGNMRMPESNKSITSNYPSAKVIIDELNKSSDQMAEKIKTQQQVNADW